MLIQAGPNKLLNLDHVTHTEDHDGNLSVFIHGETAPIVYTGERREAILGWLDFAVVKEGVASLPPAAVVSTPESLVVASTDVAVAPSAPLSPLDRLKAHK